jgi:hypothetical protein
MQKIMILLVFKKIANFIAEKWSKSPKIVIITLTPGVKSSEKSRLSAEY